MADDALFSKLNDALFARIAVIWPEVLIANGRENGVWFTEDVKTIPFAQLKAPYAVVQSAQFSPVDGYGYTHSVDRGAYSIYYVRPANGVSDRQLRDKVKLLVNHLRTRANDLYYNVAVDNGGHVQTVKVIGPLTGDQLPLNQEFISRELRTRGAGLRVEVLTKETYV